MRTLGIAGLSVTTPHKEQVAECVDGLASGGRRSSARSTPSSSRATGRLVGHSTDGHGFVKSLEADGVDPCGIHVAVIGAGAAARSIVSALDRAGAGEHRRRQPHAQQGRRRSPGSPRSPAAVAGDDPTDELAKADLIVNATSVGFGTATIGSLPIDPSVLHREHLVADLVYHPLDTALLRAAREAGARTFDGLGMLVHQAALQQHLWLGQMPDVR